MSVTSLTSGQTANRVTISASDYLVVGPGAVARATTVMSGGELDVLSRGSSFGTRVESGGAEVVLDGGTATRTTVQSGGTQLLGADFGVGYGSATTIGSGGVAILSGVELYASLDNDGIATAENAVELVGATVEAGGTLLVETYLVPTSYSTFPHGSVQDIIYPGRVSGAVVLSGGLVVDSGLDSGGIVESGGIAVVLGNFYQGLTSGCGSAADVTVYSGGLLVAMPGSVVSGTVGSLTTTGLLLVTADGSVSYAATAVSGITLSGATGSIGQLPKDALVVLPSGTATDDTVGGGGQLIVDAGGFASVDIVASGGFLSISGGVVSSATVESGGTLAVSSGIAVADIVESGGTELVGSLGFPTASALHTLVQSGGVQVVAGVARDATIESGGLQLVRGGQYGSTLLFFAGSAIDTDVQAGGRLVVAFGDGADGATIESGGGLLLTSHGLASSTTVASGGLLVVLPGGSASNTTGSVVSTGVVLDDVAGLASLGASASGLVLSSPTPTGSDGALPGDLTTLYALPGAEISDIVAGPGVTVDLFSGVDASSLSLGSGDVLSASGAAIYGLAMYGTTATIAGGKIAGFSLISGTANLNVAAAAEVSSDGNGSPTVDVTTSVLVVNGGTVGQAGYVSGNAVFSDVTVEAGGTLFVTTAAATVVQSGGTLLACAGGSEVGTTIDSGGVQRVGGTDYDVRAELFPAAVSGTQVAGGGLLVGLLGSAVGATVATEGWEIISAFGSAISTTVQTGGTLQALSGAFASGVTVDAGGWMSVEAGGSAQGIVIGNGGTASLDGGALAGGDIQFVGSGGRLILGSDQDSSFTAVISGFAVGDTIEVQGCTLGSGTHFISGGHLLAVPTESEILDVNFDPRQDFSGLVFSATSGFAGENFTLAQAPVVACFAAGTRIATVGGETPVEYLSVGERVRLARGGWATIRWLGHRRVDCTRHLHPHDVRPVRIAVDAFGAGQPARTLWLSPDHAVFVDNVLIPVRYLVNGATVAQAPTPSVDYWHVELRTHDVLLAEGLACESFLDTGNRTAFAEGGVTRLHPDLSRAVWAENGCAPLVLSGAALARSRRRLLARATLLGYRRTVDPGLAFFADGRRLPRAAKGGAQHLALPAGTQEIRIQSRTWVPAHVRVQDADTRRLGVAVATLWIDGRAASLDSVALSAGWHAPEAGLRWTDGDAAIAVSGVRSLIFNLGPRGIYWVTTSQSPLGISESVGKLSSRSD